MTSKWTSKWDFFNEIKKNLLPAKEQINMTAAMQFGEELRAARLRMYRRIKYASIALDIHRTQISQYEHGTRLPKLRTLKRICDVYGIDLFALLPLWAKAKLEKGSDNNDE